MFHHNSGHCFASHSGFPCAFVISTLASAAGLSTVALVGLNCVILTPMVSKLLQLRWTNLSSFDTILQKILLTASCISCYVDFLEFGRIGFQCLVIGFSEQPSSQTYLLACLARMTWQTIGRARNISSKKLPNLLQKKILYLQRSRR